MHLLVVDQSNVCRSPVGAAFLRKALPEAVVRQGGFVNPGRDVLPKVVRWASRRGLHLEGHQSRLVTRWDVGWAHWIFYMSPGQLDRLALLGMRTRKGVSLAQLIETRRIPDPTFVPEGTPEFRRDMEILEVALREAVVRLRERSL